MVSRPSRRDLVRYAALTATGIVGSRSAIGDAAPQTKRAAESPLPRNFVWGTATSSFQTEGALAEDGRGPSSWDSFSRLPGKIRNGDTAAVATDSYHRYHDDIALMKAIGVKAYRFSIAWPRIVPTGCGRPNAKGLDHYRRFVDALVEVGIVPFCTLYHWELPQALEDKGGWANIDTAHRFGDYAGYVADGIPAIGNYFTMNEMASFIEGGYGDGSNPPGLKLPLKQLAQCRHHAVLGHGLAVRAVRARAHGPVAIGSAEVPFIAIPLLPEERHVAAARKALLAENAWHLTVMHSGKYPEAYLRSLGSNGLVFTAEQLDIISTPTDFQGLNIYYGQTVRATDDVAGYAIVPRPSTYPHMGMRWASIDPDAMYWGPKLFADTMGISKIYITENGCTCNDVPDDTGVVYDTDRVMFLKTYLAQLQRATRDGAPVAGYFLWSLMDNFEWLYGYTARFGIAYVDFKTQKRTLKLSAHFYAGVIARNGV